MTDKSSIQLKSKAPGTERRPKLRQMLDEKSATAQRHADLHPASPSLVAQALLSEGRLRSLEERKAAPLWHRPTD